MSPAQHTPGPWHVNEGGVVVSGERNAVAIPCSGKGTYLENAEDEGIDVPRGTSSSVGRVMQEANARLIAAAPELLHACEELLRAMLSADAGTETATYITTTIDHAMRFARAAIAKAKGGA